MKTICYRVSASDGSYWDFKTKAKAMKTVNKTLKETWFKSTIKIEKIITIEVIKLRNY